MKFTVVFKTPDVMLNLLDPQPISGCEEHDIYDHDCDRCAQVEKESIAKIEAIKSVAEKFIEYGECVQIEFDTDAGTAMVLPVRK